MSGLPSPVNSPPAVCEKCGWSGPAPGFHIENSTNVTFGGGNLVDCPRCGGMARVAPGTYDFIGGIVRLVRDANLTPTTLTALRNAAKEAQQTGGDQLGEFVSANPEVAPIVNVIVQDAKPGYNRLVILLMVLTIVISYLQNARYHAEDLHQPDATPPTTLVLSDDQIDQIAGKVGRKLQPSQAKPRARSVATKRKRPPKQHGKNKRRRRH